MLTPGPQSLLIGDLRFVRTQATPNCHFDATLVKDERLTLKDLREFVSQFLLKSITTAGPGLCGPDVGAVKIRGSIRT
jgi:hypothetical protein